VRARLETLGWSQADLARSVDCTAAAISTMLKEGAKFSNMVPAINVALGLSNAARTRLNALVDTMSDQQVLALLAVAELMKR
jgi:hypothetical protein